MHLCHFIGLDLGQAQDFTGFTAPAVLERPRVYHTDPPGRRSPAYALRHLQRFPPGTHYTDVAQDLIRLMQTPPLSWSVLVVDQTGVGRAVVELLRSELMDKVEGSFWPVTISAGHVVTVDETAGWLVPRKELVGTLQVLLQMRRLNVPRSLPDAHLLVKELENFKAKVTAAKSETLEAWREGEDDDLVLALAIAAWAGEQVLPHEAEPPEWNGPLRLVV